MPFFRWQEHVKSKIKGYITDLSFSVITEVRHNSKIGISDNQEILNNIEAWWIKDYIERFGKDNTKNISVPKLTFSHYQKIFDQIEHKNQ